MLEQLRRSASYAMTGKSVGVATAPVQKSIINEAGISFSGHTEYYQEFAGVARVVMMLATKSLRVALSYHAFTFTCRSRCDYQNTFRTSD